MDRKRVLVTGAAGAVGVELVRELVKASGYIQVRTFDLPGKRTADTLSPFTGRIESVTGSIEDRETVEKIVRGVDMVIHLAAVIPPESDRRPDLVGRVNIWGTHLIIEALRKVNPEAFLLFASSVSVYGDRMESPWISVGDRLCPSVGDLYGEGKVVAEKMVRRSGLRSTIFRFTGIMSPAGVRKGRVDPLMFHMPLDTYFEMATTRDTGFALSRAVYHEEQLEGQIFNLAGGPACRIRYRDLLRRSFDILGLDFDCIGEEAFATRNFHCGFFSDSAVLEEILHFQRDSVNSYLEWMKESVPPWRRLLAHLGRNRAIRFMRNKSEPLQALKAGNNELIARYFGCGAVTAPVP